jgi:hypothetical protein
VFSAISIDAELENGGIPDNVNDYKIYGWLTWDFFKGGVGKSCLTGKDLLPNLPRFEKTHFLLEGYGDV